MESYTDTRISTCRITPGCLKILISLSVAFLLLPFSESFGQDQEVSQSLITTCNCVAFRLDDIQDYYLNQAQMRVIETFENRSASLTIGVIGNYIGEDAVLKEFLNEKLQSDSFSLDVANHGWNHEDFSLSGLQEQSQLLSDSNKEILKELGVRPSVFIAPFNRFNEDTLTAMAASGLQTISANATEQYPPFVRNVTSSAGATAIFHFPAAAKTGDLNADDTHWLGSSHAETMAEVNSSIGKYGYAVVMMHPQEYSVRQGTTFQNAVDTDQLHELDLLLDSVDAQRYKIVTISELANLAIVPEFPSHLALAVASGIGMTVAAWKVKGFRKDLHLPL